MVRRGYTRERHASSDPIAATSSDQVSSWQIGIPWCVAQRGTIDAPVEWTFQQCFSIPRDVSPSAFDPVFAEYVDSGRHLPAVIRDVRVVPRDPTEEGWTDWCAEGRLEAEDMSDFVADELAWEVFSRAAYDRIRPVFEENEWTSGTARRVETTAPRHAWGIPRQDNDPIQQLRRRLMPPP